MSCLFSTSLKYLYFNYFTTLIILTKMIYKKVTICLATETNELFLRIWEYKKTLQFTTLCKDDSQN